MTVAPSSRGGETGPTFDAFISYSHRGDDLLAPRLQAGLQRFAKPWWRRRALRVFRDESSLSANPHLWSSITDALDSSGWFVLLLSPDAASSEWVDREIRYWVAHKDPDRILPVLTDGSFAWDPELADIDQQQTDSAPPSLFGVFSEEPRWVDLRWARTDTDLHLRSPRFRAAVADVASAVRGAPKDELESEEVRQHRRTIRTAWSAGVALLALTILSVSAALVALAERNEAEAQRQVAQAETDRAEAGEALARSRELAASAINVLSRDPELSILLALEALEVIPEGHELPVESASALREAIHSSRIVHRGQIADDGYLWLALSPDGSRLAVAAEETGVTRLLDTETWEVQWEYLEPASVASAAFSPDGRFVALGFVHPSSIWASYQPPEGADNGEDLPSRAQVLDAATGSPVRTLQYPECPTSAVSSFSPDSRWLALLTGTDAEGGWCNTFWIELVDTQTWDVGQVIPLEEFALARWSADGSRLVLSSPGTVLDTDTWEEVARPPDDVDSAVLSADGSLVAGILRHGGWRIVSVYDVDSGSRVERFTDLASPGQDLVFADDGSLVATTGGAETRVWDTASGTLLHELPATGPGADLAYDQQRGLLYHSGQTGQLTVWDLSGAGQGELATHLTGNQVVTNSFQVAGSLGSHSEVIDGVQYAAAFDPSTGEVLADRLQVLSSPAALPDGRLVANLARGPRFGPGAEAGPVVIWEPGTGDLTELAGCWAALDDVYAATAPVPCTDRDGDFTYHRESRVSRDGSRLLLSAPATGPGGQPGEVILYDMAGPEEVARHNVEPLEGLLAFDGDWAVVVTDDLMWVMAMEDGSGLLDLGPWNLGATLARVEAAADGTMLAWTDLTGGFTVVSTDRWEQLLAVPGAHTGRTHGLAFSADGARLMSAGTDGLVKIWDLTTEEELHRIPLDGVADGHWITDHHILVATEAGMWTTLTLDLDELIDIARSRLTRDFTEDECATYRIAPCD